MYGFFLFVLESDPTVIVSTSQVTRGKIINKYTLKRIINIVVESMVENTSDKKSSCEIWIISFLVRNIVVSVTFQLVNIIRSQ